MWRDMSREGLGAAPDCHIVQRGETEASAVPLRELPLWRDRGQLAIARSIDA